MKIGAKSNTIYNHGVTRLHQQKTLDIKWVPNSVDNLEIYLLEEF